MQMLFFVQSFYNPFLDTGNSTFASSRLLTVFYPPLLFFQDFYSVNSNALFDTIENIYYHRF